jgi:hypothetical protein
MEASLVELLVLQIQLDKAFLADLGILAFRVAVAVELVQLV